MNTLPLAEAIPIIPNENIRVIEPVEYIEVIYPINNSEDNTFNNFINIINELELTDFIKNNYPPIPGLYSSWKHEKIILLKREIARKRLNIKTSLTFNLLLQKIQKSLANNV